MNTLTRWNPVRELEEFQNRILSAFRPVSARSGQGNGHGMELAEWSPLVNISEDDKEYRITAELPEVNIKDVKVTLENGVLTIAGERRMEKETKEQKYHLLERSHGTFSRSFSLPGDADPSKVNAEFKDGLLIVNVAKSEAAKPKQIEVRAGG
jgi:HSP20 family protein